MALGFVAARRQGIHYDLAKYAVKKLASVDLAVKGNKESAFEHTIVGYMRALPKLKNNIITQIGEEEVEKITHSHLFGFKHRPDTTIGRDGTAIEIKVVTGSQSIRELLGQAIAYRMHYRFVILLLIDKTPDHKIIELCSDKNAQEHQLMKGFAAGLNIFSIIGPKGRSDNLVFIA